MVSNRGALSKNTVVVKYSWASFGTGYRISFRHSPVTANSEPAITPAMFELLVAVVGAVRAGFRSRTGLIAANLALRQQLAVLRRGQSRPHLSPIDRGSGSCSRTRVD